MNIKEAREVIRKSRTPGEVFYCDDVSKFDLKLEIEKALCFLEGYEAGVREAAELFEGAVGERILKLLYEERK